MKHYLLFWISLHHDTVHVLSVTAFKSCITAKCTFFFSTYQILLLVLILAFSHLVVVSTLQMIIYQNLIVLIFCQTDNNH